MLITFATGRSVDFPILSRGKPDLISSIFFRHGKLKYLAIGAIRARLQWPGLPPLAELYATQHLRRYVYLVQIAWCRASGLWIVSTWF